MGAAQAVQAEASAKKIGKASLLYRCQLNWASGAYLSAQRRQCNDMALRPRPLVIGQGHRCEGREGEDSEAPEALGDGQVQNDAK